MACEKPYRRIAVFIRTAMAAGTHSGQLLQCILGMLCIWQTQIHGSDTVAHRGVKRMVFLKRHLRRRAGDGAADHALHGRDVLRVGRDHVLDGVIEAQLQGGLRRDLDLRRALCRAQRCGTAGSGLPRTLCTALLAVNSLQAACHTLFNKPSETEVKRSLGAHHIGAVASEEGPYGTCGRKGMVGRLTSLL